MAKMFASQDVFNTGHNPANDAKARQVDIGVNFVYVNI